MNQIVQCFRVTGSASPFFWQPRKRKRCTFKSVDEENEEEEEGAWVSVIWVLPRRLPLSLLTSGPELRPAWAQLSIHICHQRQIDCGWAGRGRGQRRSE